MHKYSSSPEGQRGVLTQRGISASEESQSPQRPASFSSSTGGLTMHVTHCLFGFSQTLLQHLIVMTIMSQEAAERLKRTPNLSLKNFLYYETREIKEIITPYTHIMLSYQQRAFIHTLSYLSLVLVL